MTKSTDGPKPGRTVLTPRDIEILTYVAQQRIATVDDLYKRFFAGQKLAAAKSTLRRLRGRQGGQRYLRPQPIDPKRVGYVLTRRACRTLNVPAKRSRSLGPKATIQQLAVAEYLRGDATRQVLRGDALRDFLDLGTGRPPRQFFVSEVAPDGVRLKVVFIHYGGMPRGTAMRIGTALTRLSKQAWFDGVLADRCVDIVVLTGVGPAVKPLREAVTAVVDQALYIPVRKTIGPEKPSAVVGVAVVHAATVAPLVLARDPRPKPGRGA